MSNQISTIHNPDKRQDNDVLVKVVSNEVLPAFKAYYPSSDFSWRGNLMMFANEYAKQLYGMNILVVHVRAALESARLRSATERHPPNPIEFKVLCLHARGMPTLEQCMSEINEQRIKNYGENKEWSEPLVYWLNQQIAGARATLADNSWQKMAKNRYTELAEIYGKGELSPIPLKIEYNAPPAYLKYAGNGHG
ncbi:hypothetical protein FQP85_22045 [Pseudoalteromonas neustonica]|uniref:Uncharacterized protein n=1 Tax=Pseudoalteromonas neustonica TaxID=1840331 RepID=A0ABY3F7E3_9GAMM|nr:hypothetical protein [Pseudoalteromonas neustonica]TVU79877.1 hypothetical protein FQP85_22045 [Pseudoalteromonas neustonica]